MYTRSATLTELGPVRTVNADALIADDLHAFFAVADGVGSTEASVEASRFVVNQAHRQFVERVSKRMDIEPAAFVNGLAPAYIDNFKDLARIPGTTLSVLWVANGALWYSSVGDSPVFLLEDSRAHLLTREHTAADRNTAITSFSTLKSMNGSNILVNSFGASPPRPVQYTPITVQSGHRILMCSDGLMEIVDQDTLGTISAKCPNPRAFIKEIKKRAARGRPPDNYSVIVVDLHEKEDAP